VGAGTSVHRGIDVTPTETHFPLEAFRWTEAGGMEGLGYLPSIGPATPAYRWSEAWAISRDSAVIVGRAGDGFASGPQPLPRLFRWTQPTGIIELGSPGSEYAFPTAMSGDGRVFVGETRVLGAPTYEAFIWDAVDGFRTLDAVLAGYGIDISAWSTMRANGISADGTVIVGEGVNPDGVYEAWMAVIPPLPAQCQDGVDNDADGLVDLDDPGCPFAFATTERPLCDDGIDNDADGLTDFADPLCTHEWPYWERRPCGIGAELALVVPLLARLRTRRWRARG
jgi:hypothetical protein